MSKAIRLILQIRSYIIPILVRCNSIIILLYTQRPRYSTSDPLAQLQPVAEAMYDSIECHVSGCLVGTRQEIIGRIVGWIDGTSNRSICWLYGAAGSGKSAISSTIARMCSENGRLGASYFFFRGAGRRSRIAHLISTLAYHLAFSIPATRPYIERALQRDHQVLHRSLDSQFQRLIVEPIRSVIMPALPMVIVIDGLDECDDKGISEFIGIVAHATQNHPLSLKFFFTSRVENHIQGKFSTSPVLDTTYRLALHDFNPDVDIRTFFRSRFSTIYQAKSWLMRNILLPWPSESDLDILVAKSSESFIFAFTLINFVDDGSDLPHLKLQAALESHAGLDPLYTQVLRTAPRSPHFARIFETIMTITEYFSILDLADFFQLETGHVIHALLGLQSILNVPENDELPVRPFHTSLRDFLTTKARSNDLFIDPVIRHLSIASDCLEVMAAHGGDDFFDSEAVGFACLHWSHHFLCAIREEGGDDPLLSQYSTLMTKLTAFVSRSFDSWTNFIIYKVEIRNALKTLDSVVSVLKVSSWYYSFSGVVTTWRTFIVQESRRSLPNMLLMMEKIRTFVEVWRPMYPVKMTQ